MRKEKGYNLLSVCRNSWFFRIFEKISPTMKASSICIFLLSVAIIGCSSRQRRELTRIEQLLYQYPDSALILLNRMDPEELSAPKDKARYALLLSMAYDKNYIDMKDDSFIRPAVDYYSIHQGKYRMLSWYYYGLVLLNAHSYPAAIIAFEEAEKDAQLLKDSHSLGLINRNKANVFSLVNNHSEAIRYRKQAVSFFDKAQEVSYLSYAALSLAIDYLNNRDYDKADSLFNYIRNQYRDTVLIRYCNLYQAGIMAELDKQPKTAISLYNRVSEKYYSMMDYGYKAISFEGLSQPDSANYCIEKGYSVCFNQADSASLDYMKSRVEMRRGNYSEAFRLVDHALSIQDSLTRILLQQSVSNAQRDYYQSETRLKEEKNKAIRQRFAFVVILSGFLVSILLMAFIHRSRKTDSLLKDQLARLAFNERELDRVNRDNAHLLGSLFSEKIDHLDKMIDSYFKMESGKQKDLAFSHIKQQVSLIRSDEELFLSLEKDLDRFCNHIMAKLRGQVPEIKGENLKIITLFFAGFSYETTQFILSKNSVESLKTTRSRIRNMIKASSAPDKEVFLKMLEMKSGRRPVL